MCVSKYQSPERTGMLDRADRKPRSVVAVRPVGETRRKGERSSHETWTGGDGVGAGRVR